MVDGDARGRRPGRDERGQPGSSSRCKAARDDAGELGGLPAQALVEDEIGHRCWGVSPVDHGLGHRIPQRGATCAG